MTKYYYDYVANIAFPKHLATSNIISPILNFYPAENAIFADNKYDIVQKINESDLDKLGKYIFIEKMGRKDLHFLRYPIFLIRKNYLDYSEKDFLEFNSNLGQKIYGRCKFQLYC